MAEALKIAAKKLQRSGLLDDIKKEAKSKVGIVDDLRTFGRALKLMDRDVKNLRQEMEDMQRAPASGSLAQNAGAGLFFTKSIASVNRDFFVIYSGSGFFKLLKKSAARRRRLNADPFADRHSTSTDMPFWRGTVVGVDITLDQTAEFSLLLDAIQDTYSSAVRERRRSRRKRPRFT